MQVGTGSLSPGALGFLFLDRMTLPKVLPEPAPPQPSNAQVGLDGGLGELIYSQSTQLPP